MGWISLYCDYFVKHLMKFSLFCKCSNTKSIAMKKQPKTAKKIICESDISIEKLPKD